MCDISKPIKSKQVVVYKVVHKVSGKYYSYFAGTLIGMGQVSQKVTKRGVNYSEYKPSYMYYNFNMIKRCSGFKLLADAKGLKHDSVKPKQTLAILKIVLTATKDLPIMEGTANAICTSVPYDNVTYAGPIIKSIKEIK